MADKAKHAYGSRKNLDAAIASGAVDAYDVLFLNGEGETPAMGWVDKNGNPVIVEGADLSGVEAELATKANAEEVKALENQMATKANADEVTELGNQIATKVNAAEVDEKINTAVTDSVATAKSYTDGKVEAAINEHMAKKYEITSVPTGTLVDYRDHEIRIMAPTNSQWTKQNVGVGGDANCYYVTFKTYVLDDNIVGYREHLGDKADSETLTDFSIDEYGRRYQPTWLAIAKYDEATNTWSYYGEKSSKDKFVGWDYQIDWYDANGVVIASDNVRINLSNENCHSSIEPYYVGSMIKEIDAKIEEKIAEAESSYEIVEF